MANTKIPVELSSTPGIVDNSNATAITIDSSENVGIGTTPHSNSKLHVLDASASFDDYTIHIESYQPAVVWQDISGGPSTDFALQADGSVLMFRYGDATTETQLASEAMRLDSSGNLLVGQTSGSSADTGHILNPNGIAFHVRDGGICLVLDRLTSDGDIQTFRKDGTIVGSIGVDFSDNLFISGKSDHAGLMFSNIEMYPYKNGTYVDATLDIGASSGRWKDLYLSGGVYLGGTGAANKLDDYEEGTWTPVVRDSSGTVGTIMAISATNCKYTKVGKVVTITGQITRNDATSLTGNLFITGLPFTQFGGQQMGGSVWVDNISGDVLGLITGGDSTIFNVRSIASPDAYVTTNQWSNNRPIYFSRTYTTT